MYAAKTLILAIKAFYVFLDPDFPALFLIINSAAFGTTCTEKQYAKLRFCCQIPKAIRHCEGYQHYVVTFTHAEYTGNMHA